METLLVQPEKRSDSMTCLIFRTGIKTKKRVRLIKPLLDGNPLISRWCIDLDDVDKVLKIEAEKGLRENDVISIIQTTGFYCETLPD